MVHFTDLIRARIDDGEVFDWEAMLESFYRCWIQPGDTVIDVGAHRGRHLRPMWEAAGDGGKVIAFEPLPDMFQVLTESFSASNVTLINAAVSTEKGDATFVFAQGTPEESGFRERVYNRPDLANPISIHVATQNLDVAVEGIENIAFIKIDVEGAELICLASSLETIRAHRPVISVEYGRPSYSVYGNSCDDLHRFAMSVDYKLFDLFLNDISEISDWRKACDSVYWDFLLVPSEKVGEVHDRCRTANKC